VDDASPSPATSYRVLARTAPLTGFAPTSVTFVSTRTGWFLGTAACGGEQRCAVLLQTRDAGRSFTRRTPPPMRVSEVRFANLQEGWAFGNNQPSTLGDPGLWRTHDGGDTWRRVLGTPVPSLEIGRGIVWAVELDGAGTSPRLFRGSLTGNALTFASQIPNRSATVTVGHGTAYVIAEQGAGPIATSLLAASAQGVHRRTSPCTDKYAWNLQVAIRTPQHLTAICRGESSAGSQRKHAYASADDGRTWTRQPDPPWAGYTGTAGSLAGTSTSVFMTGPRNGINKKTGRGAWRQVLDSDEGLGFFFVGFTDDTHGVALSERAAWMTDSAGEHWRRLPFT
jgi:hypothetical protein